ncbi:MAG: ATP-binding cassette domain-containing protein [Magnetovibrionaceae bacterium]
MSELFARLARRPGLSLELLLASFFANLLALASPIFVIQVLNRYVTHGVDTTLATLTAGVMIAILLEFGFRQVRLRIAHAVSATADAKLNEATFGMLTGTKSAAIDLLPAHTRREVVQGVETVQGAYAASNLAAVLDVPFALLFLGVLYLLAPPLAFIAAVVLAFVLFCSLITLLSLRGPTKDLIATQGRRGILVGSALTAADTVRAFTGAGFLRGNWGEESTLFARLKRIVGGRNALLQNLTQSSQAIMGAAVIATGAFLVVRGELDVGALIGANILAARAVGPIAKFAQLSEQFAKAGQSLTMLREFLKLPVERVQGSGLSVIKGRLDFQDLAFAHPGANRVVFEKLTLRVEPGSVLVVTGGNGTGKTTLARLLAGLLEPVRGQILVDGVDIAQLAPEWWRRQLIYLPQEPKFLSATIRENLMAFNPNLDDARLAQLVSAAGLRSFLDQSNQGLDTPLPGGGETLALGIRRRLALARALACDGRIAILDEPTEGMDTEGANAVYAVMNRLAEQGRTIIAFSHDPNIAKGAAQVLDLNVKPTPRVLAQAASQSASAQSPNAPPANMPPGRPPQKNRPAKGAAS